MSDESTPIRFESMVGVRCRRVAAAQLRMLYLRKRCRSFDAGPRVMSRPRAGVRYLCRRLVAVGVVALTPWAAIEATARSATAMDASQVGAVQRRGQVSAGSLRTDSGRPPEDAAGGAGAEKPPPGGAAGDADARIARDAAPAATNEQSGSEVVDPELVRSLIAELDAPEYSRRRAATDRLAKLGAPAIPALVEAARSAVSLERSVRAVEILKRLYLSGDSSVFEAAEAALTKLAECPVRPVAAAASDVLERFGDHVRLVHAVRQIERLGGSVKFSEVPVGFIAPGDLPLIQYVLIGMDWKGGDEGLKYVARLPTIGVVYFIRGAPVSEEAIKKLQQQRPDLRIQYRGRAYLGIAGGTTPGEGCLISQVQPEGAAAKAGLRAGDVILKFGGTPVTDFDQLVELIGKKAPGDKVEVVIRRNGQQMTIPVVLGSWK
ncbi:MAG: PDZ domain-containing protein [Planctomycetota bacterium]|nr:MAG: PDZ domain-containing protein [Planctomycetota bacterium]